MRRQKKIYLNLQPNIKENAVFRDIFSCGVDGLLLSFSDFTPDQYKDSMQVLLSLTGEMHFFPDLYAEISFYDPALLPYFADYGITDLLLHSQISPSILMDIKKDLMDANLSHIRIHSYLETNRDFSDLIHLSALFDSLYIDHSKGFTSYNSPAESFIASQELLEELAFARIPVMTTCKIQMDRDTISTSCLAALSFYVKSGCRDLLLYYSGEWSQAWMCGLKNCCDVIYASRKPRNSFLK